MNLRARYLSKTFTGIPFALLNTTILGGGVLNWILYTGSWDDSGYWVDLADWNDGV